MFTKKWTEAQETPWGKRRLSGTGRGTELASVLDHIRIYCILFLLWGFYMAKPKEFFKCQLPLSCYRLLSLPFYPLRNQKSSQHIFRYNALGQARGNATVNKIRSTLRKVLVSGRTYLVDQYKAGKNNSPPPESAAHMPPSYMKRPIICLQNKGPASSMPGVVSQLWQVVPIIPAQKQSTSFLTSPKAGLNGNHVCLGFRNQSFFPPWTHPFHPFIQEMFIKSLSCARAMVGTGDTMENRSRSPWEHEATLSRDRV